MASLVEELIETLENEESLYDELIPIAERKMNTIVDNNLEELQSITEKEHSMIDRVTSLEVKRTEIVKNIGVVLNRNSETLDLKTIISILEKQPEEQRRLKLIHDKLTRTVGRLQGINHQNKQLIEESLEMIEFNMNFIQSTRMSSGSSNYTKRASMNDTAPSQAGTFDAKQ